MAANSDRSGIVVIGGGPAGSTVATLLARAGLSVSLLERRRFPRFHIGESLLPGSMPILQELGVYQEVNSKFMKKPGGKWYYGDRAVFSDFSDGPRDTSFVGTPHAYMVKRAEFDQVLLDNAARSGVQVFQEHTVTDLVQEGERVVGVTVRDNATGQSRDLPSDMVFDCSGFNAVTARKFRLRKENRLRTIAVFGHYRTLPIDKDVKNGWIVAPMLHNGWVWMIPLEKDLVSVGVVASLDQFAEARRAPQQFLENHMSKLPIVANGLSQNPVLQGDIHIYGNLGYTSSQLSGNGWVMVGDAAFFIDPCYSSGVHLALSMAKKAVALYLDCRAMGRRSSAVFAQQYEKYVRQDEKLVLRLVDAFYMASRNRILRRLIPLGNTRSIARRFVAVTGGDFMQHPLSINMLYFMCKAVSRLLPLPTPR